jgi:6-pyruvoyltetrahydropterin/6-carboxytetrahydropterin synthase
MIISVSRKEYFNAAHRLHNPNWDDAKNKAIFGLCNNRNYHGHNYELIVKITGEVDHETGFLLDLKSLKTIVRTNVTDRFDHRNLNLDIVEFKNLNTTVENIAFVIWNILREKIELKFALSITLYETEKNFVEYSGK